MARNIFNQSKEITDTKQSTVPTSHRAGNVSASVGGLRDSLRQITANSIRDLETDQIEVGGVKDRLSLDVDGIDELAESIRKHGQQVPILVRPTSNPDRFRVVYGRRRLAAVRRIGGTIKAIIKSLDDEETVIAQGQENSLRLDPSFIEKALFIREMLQLGYKTAIIQDALGLSRQGVSNHKVIIDNLPLELIELLGSAHGIGRRQWAELVRLGNQLDILSIAKETIETESDKLNSSERFTAVLDACRRSLKNDRKKVSASKSRKITTKKGTVLGSISEDDVSISIRLNKRDYPELGSWVEKDLENILSKIVNKTKNTF